MNWLAKEAAEDLKQHLQHVHGSSSIFCISHDNSYLVVVPSDGFLEIDVPEIWRSYTVYKLSKSEYAHGCLMALSSEEREILLKHRKTKEEESKWKPKLRDSYTVEEKVAAFDKLYDMAYCSLQEEVEEPERDSDDEHWMYEAVMNLLGPGVWDYICGLEKKK